MIHSSSSGLLLDRNYFGGSAQHGGHNDSVVYHRQWRDFEATGNIFRDYGVHMDVEYTKTPISGPLAWIGLEHPYQGSANAAENALTQARFIGSHFDEGAKYAVSAYPGSAPTQRISRFWFEGNEVNVSAQDGGAGLRLNNVDDAVIRHSRFALAQYPREMVRLYGCGRVTIDACPTSQMVDGIKAHYVTLLTLIDTSGITRFDFLGMKDANFRRITNGVTTMGHADLPT